MRQASELTKDTVLEIAWSSPTHLAVANATKKRTFLVRFLRKSKDREAQKEKRQGNATPRDKSQAGGRTGRGGASTLKDRLRSQRTGSEDIEGRAVQNTAASME